MGTALPYCHTFGGGVDGGQLFNVRISDYARDQIFGEVASGFALVNELEANVARVNTALENSVTGAHRMSTRARTKTYPCLSALRF